MGIGLTLAVAGAAFAYWAVTAISGSGIYAEATSQTLPTGATPSVSVSPAANQTVTITFAQASSSGGTALTAYNVKRYLVGSSSGTLISGGCSVVSSVVTCTDAPGAGSWNYTDIPAIASSSWTGAESAKSSTAIVQALPTLSVSASSATLVTTPLTPSATLAGATSTPVPGGSITYSVFGPQATAPSTCTGTGWSTVGSAVSVTGNGLYISSASYTPTAAGTYWWYASYGGDTYNASANSGCSATSTVVHLAMSPATGSSLLSVAVYAPYSQTIGASGGTSPYAFAASGLPAGLSINSSSGVISGTITSSVSLGTTSVTITATDATGKTGTATYTLVVTAPTFTFSPTSGSTLTGTTVYTVYAGQTVTATAPTAFPTDAFHTYAASGLPTGLSINSSTGVISGTITSSVSLGATSVTITATDTNSYTATATYTLVVTAPTFTFSPTSGSTLLTATAAFPYSSTITASVTGYSGGFTYSITSGAPSTLTIGASSGIISGTPAAGGPYSIIVKAVDSSASSYSASATYSLTVFSVSTLFANASSPCTATLGVLGGSSACTSPSISPTSGDTELIVAYVKASVSLGTISASISTTGSPFTSTPTALPTSSVNPFSGTGSVFAWVATGGTSSGTVSVTASTLIGLGISTVVDVVQFSGSQSILQTVTNSGSGTSAIAKLTTPTSTNDEITLTASVANTLFTSANSSSTIDHGPSSGPGYGLFLLDPAAASQSFTMGTSGGWGTIGFEIKIN